MEHRRRRALRVAAIMALVGALVLSLVTAGGRSASAGPQGQVGPNGPQETQSTSPGGAGARYEVEISPQLELVSGVLQTIDRRETWERLPTNGGTGYYQELKDFFAPYRDDPAMKIAARLYDSGMHTDRFATFAMHLGPLPDLELRYDYNPAFFEPWEREQLEAFRLALRHLAARSDFAGFLAKWQPAYDTWTRDVRARFDGERVIAWLEDFFGDRRAGYRLVLAPGLPYGCGLGPWLVGPGGTVTVDIVQDNGRSSTAPNFGDQFTLETLAAHEWGHSYVNPLVAEYAVRLSAFGRFYRGVRPSLRSIGYDSVAAYADEQVLRAIVCVAVEDLYGTERAEEEIADETNEGFRLTRMLAGALRDYRGRRAEYPTFRAYLPELFAAVERQPDPEANRRFAAALATVALLVYALMRLVGPGRRPPAPRSEGAAGLRWVVGESVDQEASDRGGSTMELSLWQRAVTVESVELWPERPVWGYNRAQLKVVNHRQRPLTVAIWVNTFYDKLYPNFSSFTARLVNLVPGPQEVICEFLIRPEHGRVCGFIQMAPARENEWTAANAFWTHELGAEFCLPNEACGDFRLPGERRVLMAPFVHLDGERIVIYYSPGTPAERDAAKLLAEREAAIANVCALLTCPPPEWRIACFFYPDEATKFLIARHRGWGYAYERTVVEVYNERIRCHPAHEICHIVSAAAGDPPAAIDEGLAVYLEGDWDCFGTAAPRRPAAWAKEFKTAGRLFALADLLALPEIGPPESAPEVVYPQAGALVAFLIERHGLDAFRRVFRELRQVRTPADQAANADVIRSIYGCDLATLEAEWLAWLGEQEG